MNEQDGLQLAMLTTAFEGRVDITTADHGRYVAYRVLRKDAERIIAALAASEREQRLRAVLRDLIPFTEEAIDNGYRPADVPIVMADPIMQRARAALSETGPAGPGRGAEPIACTRCGDPITDGYMIGDGDGSGQRFAHPECYRQYPGAYKLREPLPPITAPTGRERGEE